jgi:hypothetical protein
LKSGEFGAVLATKSSKFVDGFDQNMLMLNELSGICTTSEAGKLFFFQSCIPQGENHKLGTQLT